MAGRVLLIEDEVNIAEAIRFLLTRDGCEVEVLADGHAAVAAVARVLPDLVILDLMLPGMSGSELLQRTDRAHRHIDEARAQALQQPARCLNCRLHRLRQRRADPGRGALRACLDQAQPGEPA